MPKRVAVVGGGPCGIGALSALRDEGLDAVCYEKTGSYGGLWRYRDDDLDGTASVMKTTIINTSKELGAFSNMPPPAEFPNYMHQTLMLKYIAMSAEKEGVAEKILYHRQVVRIEKSKDYQTTGRWLVTSEHTQTKEQMTDEFDAVMVCIGHHVYPNIPTFAGQEKFQGTIMHTHSLKKVDKFDDQVVVVVGVGNSGMDAAVEISNVAKQVYLCSRRGTWVLPRVGSKGHPIDTIFLRRFVVFVQRLLPYNLVCSFIERTLNERFNHAAYNMKPKHRALSQHPTISDTLPIKLLSGTVLTRGAIKSFTENGVIFENEEKETLVDTVILATGYKIKFPFLSEDIVRVKENNKVSLFKFIFPPDLPHTSLAIMGLVQPSGPGFPVGELQCRWVARVLGGKCGLPSKAEMYEDIRKQEEFNDKRYVNSPRHTLEVDFIGYQDDLAERIGAKPDFQKIFFTDPKLWWALIMGPTLPYQYRLQGPHSWDGARDAILTYKERVLAPLRRPGQAPYKHKRSNKIVYLFLIGIIVVIFSLFWQS